MRRLIGNIIGNIFKFFFKEVYIRPFREVVTHDYETGESIIIKEKFKFDMNIVLEKKNLVRLMVADIVCDIMLILFIIYLLK